MTATQQAASLNLLLARKADNRWRRRRADTITALTFIMLLVMPTGWGWNLLLVAVLFDFCVLFVMWVQGKIIDRDIYEAMIQLQQPD
jgi:hypothetical protein